MQASISRQLRSFVEKLDLKPGDRLPAERTFAETLNISRNSLRKHLHIMEGQGLVEVKKGSGTFLKNRFFSPSEKKSSTTRRNPHKIIADQLEMAVLLFPAMVELSAERMDDKVLTRLQKANVELGRSIFSTDPQKFWTQSLIFLRLIALSTNNRLMQSILEEIYNIDGISPQSPLYTSRKNREVLFGHHVNLLNALKKKNSSKAGKLMRAYIMDMPKIIGIKREFIPDTLIEEPGGETHDS